MLRLCTVGSLALGVFLAESSPAHTQPVVPVGFEDARVASVASPTALAVTPDGRLLIGSQWGQVYVLRSGVLTTAVNLDAQVCTYRERGLLGLAVDPQFASNRFIYASYIFNKSGDCEREGAGSPVGRVSRFVLSDNDTVDPATERVLLDNIPSPSGVHNVGDVEFGKDGYLYVSVGDGGCDYTGVGGCFDSNNAARDMHALVGKVLRITRDGGIPPGNPFTGSGTARCASTGTIQAGLVCQEIFATGLRNPWRLAFDPNAGSTRFFINDVGQDTWEEINQGVAGADYGWNLREGFCANGSTTNCSNTPPPGLTNPVYAYTRTEACASVTGGAFVPNGVWPVEFDGVYLFSDYVCGTIFKLRPATGGGYTRQAFITGLGVSSATDLYFGRDASGTALYYTSYANGGEVRRIRYAGSANRRPTAALTANPTAGYPPLAVTFDGRASSDPDGDPLTHSWDFGDGTPAGSGPAVNHTYGRNGTYTATLRVADTRGASASASVRIDVGNTPPNPVIVSPTPDQRFAVGDLVVLRGRATDSEDGELPGSSLKWVVLLHHNAHTHGFLPSTSGSEVTFRAPGPENLEAAATSYLEVQLMAVDSMGRSTTSTQAFMPRVARLDFLANPSGAPLRVDNAQVTTPASFMSWVGFGVSVDAQAYVAADGTRMTFASWSDGGAAAHTVVTPATASSYTAIFKPALAGSSIPFHGTPAALPGTVQAEDFDTGGEGVAWHDTTAVNEGRAYRPTSSVDIAPAADTGGGYTLGWVRAGEWLKYSVNVAVAGKYDIEVRVAAATTGGTFHIEANGVDITGPMTVPATGDWQSWTTIRKPGVQLSAGPQVWRVVMDRIGATSVGNFNYFRVTAPASTPFRGAPIALPGTVQAEDFDSGGEGVAYHDNSSGNSGGQYRPTSNVDIAAASDATGNYTLGWVGSGEWLKYSVSVAAAGQYDIEIRVASAGAGGTFHIEVNGTDVTGSLAVPNTGGWQTWTTIRRTGVQLAAGPQLWRIVMDTRGASGAVGNFNYVRVLRP